MQADPQHRALASKQKESHVSVEARKNNKNVSYGCRSRRKDDL
jgi:hypothetical protein